MAAYVSFGGPEGNQHNAACSILECLVERQGAPVAQRPFMNLGTYYFEPIWWTKRSMYKHYILKDKCIACGACVEKCPVGGIDLAENSVNREACVLCFGCLNNCPAQAMYMDYDGSRLIGYKEFLKIKHLKVMEPLELKT